MHSRELTISNLMQHDAFMTRLVEELQFKLRGSQVGEQFPSLSANFCVPARQILMWMQYVLRCGLTLACWQETSELSGSVEEERSERLIGMYEQRIENLQQENDKIRNKSLTRQIEIDDMREQASSCGVLVIEDTADAVVGLSNRISYKVVYADIGWVGLRSSSSKALYQV